MLPNSQIRSLRESTRSKKANQHLRILRAISGRARWHMLLLLRSAKNGLTTTDFAVILKATLSRVSHQLRILKRGGLVQTKREGRNVIYSLANPLINKYVRLP